MIEVEGVWKMEEADYSYLKSHVWARYAPRSAAASGFQLLCRFAPKGRPDER